RGQHGLDGVAAGVTLRAATHALQCLLGVVHREHAEAAGDAREQLHLLNAARGLAAHVVVVVCLTTDHRAQADDRLISAGLRAVTGDQRQLERAWYLEAVDLLNAGLLQRRPCAGLQPIGQVLVEARNAQRDPEVLPWAILAHGLRAVGRHHARVSYARDADLRPARPAAFPRPGPVPDGAGCARASRA